MYPLIRPLLFSINPETAHSVSMASLEFAHKSGLAKLLYPAVENPVELMGLRFSNRVGLAAGLDKNSDHIDALGALGFGFIEIGTVTPRPQPGNAKPRLFRLPEAQAIINRMGFNNLGVEHLVERARERRYPGVLGINVGKNFDTALEDAAQDYLSCIREAYDFADYLTVNISSPNTPGLRELQSGDELENLCRELVAEVRQLNEESDSRVPLLVKIAPDLDTDQIRHMADTLVAAGVDGVIATNTTLERGAVQGLKHANEQGGLSGAPVRELSTKVIQQLSGHLQGAIPIIGVGGIETAEHAQEKIEAGADLVQIYSGFIYRGPAMISEIASSLVPTTAPKSNSETNKAL